MIKLVDIDNIIDEELLIAYMDVLVENAFDDDVKELFSADEIIGYLKDYEDKKGRDDDRKATKSLKQFRGVGNQMFVNWSGEDEEFKEEGMTHGLLSHAIKHGEEYVPELYDKVFDKMKNFIRSKKNNGILKYATPSNASNKLNKQNLAGKLVDDGEVKDDYITNYTIYNTLNHINDKIYYPSSGTLTTNDKEILKIFAPVLWEYEKVYSANRKNVGQVGLLNKGVTPAPKNRSQEEFEKGIENYLSTISKNIKKFGIDKEFTKNFNREFRFDDLNNNDIKVLKNPNSSVEMIKIVLRKVFNTRYVNVDAENKGVDRSNKFRNKNKFISLDGETFGLEKTKSSDELRNVLLDSPSKIITSLISRDQNLYFYSRPNEKYPVGTIYSLSPEGTLTPYRKDDGKWKAMSAFKPASMEDPNNITKRLLFHILSERFNIGPNFREFLKKMVNLDDEKFNKIFKVKKDPYTFAKKLQKKQDERDELYRKNKEYRKQGKIKEIK